MVAKMNCPYCRQENTFGVSNGINFVCCGCKTVWKGHQPNTPHPEHYEHFKETMTKDVQNELIRQVNEMEITCAVCGTKRNFQKFICYKCTSTDFSIHIKK